MSTIAEIESAIEKLPASQVEELAIWLDALRSKQRVQPSVDAWLERARGAAQPGITTAELMKLRRGDE